MPVPDAHVQVAVDAVEVEQVELFERLPVALLAALDEPPHVGGRVVAGRAAAWVASSAIHRGNAPVAPHLNRLRSRAEPDATFPRETLHVDDPLQGDRVAAVLGVE